MKKTAFVTGGTGKIGVHLVKRLLDENFDVRVLTRRDSNPWPNDKNISLVNGDINDTEIIEKNVQKNDYVFHLSVYNNPNDLSSETFNKVNVLGTKNLLKICSNSKVKKFINISSTVVFKPTGNTPRNESWELCDNTDSDHYASTKLESLNTVRDLSVHSPDSITVVTIIPPVVLDLNDFKVSAPPNLSFFQKFIWENIGGGIPGGVINLIGRGDRKLTYVIVEDLVEGILLAAYKGSGGQEYIIGSECIEVDGYLRAASKRMGKSVFPFRIPVFPFKILSNLGGILNPPPIVHMIAKNISNDMCHTWAKAEKELGYQPMKKL